MLSLEKLKKAYKKVEEENWMLRAFLKGQDPDEVDRIAINATGDGSRLSQSKTKEETTWNQR